MNFSLYIAKRYLFSKSDNNAINYITIIAALGVIIGSAALFIVLSGFAGLKEFSLQFTSVVDPDLKAISQSGKTFVLTQDDLDALKNVKGIASYSKIIEERVFLEYDDKTVLASIKGVDKNFAKVTTIDSIVKLGSWLEPNAFQVVAGWGISRELSFGVLDYGKSINIYVPKPGKGQISSVKSAFNSVNVVNVGIFDINEELNSKYIYASIETAQTLLNNKTNQVSALEFKLDETASESDVKSSLEAILGARVSIKNREQLNDALYKMLNTEYLAVYLIFTLVLIIALFNVIGSIIMMILDKKRDIKTLLNLGVDTGSIKKVFFLQGSLMTVFGGFIGVLLGIILVLNQLYGPELLKIYITTSLPYPVSLKLTNLIIVTLTISILGIVASKIASSRITKELIVNN